MTNSVDPDQTAPIGAVCSWSTLFASILKFVMNVWQLFATEDFSRRNLQIIFAGISRVKILTYPISMSFNKSCFAKYAI